MNPMQAPNVGPGGKDFGNKGIEKPRVNFCWMCERKLWGRNFVERIIPELTGDNIQRILHKRCFREYLGEG